MAEADLVTHDAIFYGVFERSVEQDLHFLSSDKAHLDDALAESAMAGYLDDDATLTGMQF